MYLASVGNVGRREPEGAKHGDCGPMEDRDQAKAEVDIEEGGQHHVNPVGLLLRLRHASCCGFDHRRAGFGKVRQDGSGCGRQLEIEEALAEVLRRSLESPPE